jgi:hypothetical protein
MNGIRCVDHEGKKPQKRGEEQWDNKGYMTSSITEQHLNLITIQAQHSEQQRCPYTIVLQKLNMPTAQQTNDR